MKKITLLILTFISICSTTIAQVNDSTAKKNNSITIQEIPPIEKIKIGIPKIQFIQYACDFGHIPQGIPVSFEFQFVNNGTGVISILDVKSSCGCTAPEWKNEQLKKGESGKIKAIYNSATEGNFNKNITVSFSDGSSEVLVIKGFVDPPPYAPPPPTRIPDSPLVTPDN